MQAHKPTAAARVLSVQSYCKMGVNQNKCKFYLVPAAGPSGLSGRKERRFQNIALANAK